MLAVVVLNRRFPLGAARFVKMGTSAGGVAVGVASLQGVVCTLRGQTGIRPSRPPGLALQVPIWMVYVAIKAGRVVGRIKRLVTPKRADAKWFAMPRRPEANPMGFAGQRPGGGEHP